MAKRIGANKRKSISEKKKNVKKKVRFSVKRLSKVCAVIVILSAITAGVVFGVKKIGSKLQNKSLFRIEAIRVRGVERIDTSTVVALSGIQQGGSLLKLKKAAIEEKLSGLPWAAAIKVSKRYPETVVITVRERKPIALVASSDVFLLDEEGMLVELPSKEYFNLPVFSGLADSVLADGRRMLVDKDKQSVVTFLKQLHKTQPEIAARLAQASFDKDGSVRIGLEASPVVIALELSRVSTGISHLWHILQSIHAGNARTPKSIDLRYNNMAYVQ